MARSIEAEILSTCRQHGIGMLSERNLSIASEVTGTASGLGASPASVALARATRQPGVTAVIIGPRTLGQLQDSPPSCHLTS